MSGEKVETSVEYVDLSPLRWVSGSQEAMKTPPVFTCQARHLYLHRTFPEGRKGAAPAAVLGEPTGVSP